LGAVGWRTATIAVHTVEVVAAVTEGRLPGGLPYLRLGQGPPLVMALGGVAAHANPGGAVRRVSLATAARFADHFTVYVTSRKPGLAPGTTMAGIAADYAAAIGEEFGGPVAFHGASAGGAIGLQLAIGYLHLVLAAAACRLSPSGRHLLAGVARLATAGDSRRASALVARALVPGSCVLRPVRWLGW
ncbi:MAG TPA: hypothetical protein VLW53_08090, partial [Candidatus Eisenbacteria bacterium]|nr:hypothetical protein [Candidatus Eisenbacteria bacterium]